MCLLQRNYGTQKCQSDCAPSCNGDPLPPSMRRRPVIPRMAPHPKDRSGEGNERRNVAHAATLSSPFRIAKQNRLHLSSVHHKVVRAHCCSCCCLFWCVYCLSAGILCRHDVAAVVIDHLGRCSHEAQVLEILVQRFQSLTGPSAKPERDSGTIGGEQPASSRCASAQFNARTLEHVSFFCRFPFYRPFKDPV